MSRINYPQMRKWIPLLNREDGDVDVGSDPKSDTTPTVEDESPEIRELLKQDNVSETKTELEKVWENDREQAYFFLYAVCAGVGFIGLLYYYGGFLPWYTVGGYLLVVLSGLGLFNDAFDEAPHKESESAIIQFLKR